MPVVNRVILSDIDGTLLSDKENYTVSEVRTQKIGGLIAKINEMDVSPEIKEKAIELTPLLNYALLEEKFKKEDKNNSQDITEIYLFTDMIFPANSIKERKALIILLEALGYKVSAIITPIDLFWPYLSPQAETADTPEVIQLSYMETAKKYNYNKPQPFLDAVKEKYEAAYNMLMSIIEKDPTTQPAALLELFLNAEPGCAYREAESGIEYGAINYRSQIAKALLEILTEKLGYKHAKSLMLKHALARIDSTKYDVFDDDPKVQDGINQVITEKAKETETKSNKTITYSHIKIANSEVTPATAENATKKLKRIPSQLPKSKSLTITNSNSGSQSDSNQPKSTMKLSRRFTTSEISSATALSQFFSQV